MTDKATAANPSVLRWARERAGMSQEDVAKKLKRDVSEIREWETGADSPSFRLLQRLAESYYKRPIAIFFFPNPPEEVDLKAEFRTLPDRELDSFEAETRLAVREARGYVESLHELTNGTNPSERNILTQVRPRAEESPEELGRRVRAFLGITVPMQQSWHKLDEAMKAWRAAVEESGVFVFKRSISQKTISGFCLQDRVFPIIVVNNSTPFTRQQFTLFHELGHLLFAVSGITRMGDDYLARMSPADRAIEIACNSFAAEVLLPSSSFPWAEFPGNDLEQTIARVAGRYSLSREVVLRRLLDGGRVSQEVYGQLSKKWNEPFESTRESAGGGNYYANQATYLGDAFIRLVLGQYHSKRIGIEEAANHFRVKARAVSGLEDFFEAHR